MNYANGKIYSIRNYLNDKVYIGSTTQSLAKRFSAHKGQINANKTRNRPLYIAMRELGVTNFYIELIELYPCTCKDELHAREGHYIRQYDSFNNGYNRVINGRTQKEYRKENKEQLLNYQKEYYNNNKDQIQNSQRQYYNNNKEQIQNYQKQYREENKEQILNYQNEYYNNNKEQLLNY